MFRIAVYKALYRLFGGFVADVVAAIDQVCNTTMIKINKRRKEIGRILVVLLIM